MSKHLQIVLAVDTANTHQRKIAQGVAAYAHQHGNWDVHLVQYPRENLPYLTIDPLEQSSRCHRWQADGIIASFSGREIAATVRRLNAPVVGIEAEYGWCNPKWGIPYYATDNEAIGQMAAEDFIERGLKQLAFCGVPRTRYTGWSEQRQLAFERYGREAGAPCSVFTGGSSPGRARAPLYRKLSAWLTSLPKPVGLMACYDIRARHVLLACRSLGLLVPEDVSVIGVDNDELMCELTSPPLSSIEQGSRTLGYQAAALLGQLMAGQKAPRLKFPVKPEGIVTRQSSDALAIEDADVAAALRFIRQRACEGIQVRDVVRAVAVSRSALEMRFKAMTGRTIHVEIQRVQFGLARQLVAATDMSLKQVAVKAGFRYLQHMTTIFRRHTSQTPGEYRKHSRD
jgi:LacI family transcriptional regulator